MEQESSRSDAWDAHPSEIEYDGRRLVRQEVGYASDPSDPYRVKSLRAREEDFQGLRDARATIAAIYADLPRLLPELRIVPVEANGRQVYGELVEWAAIRGFITAATPWKSEAFGAYLRREGPAAQLRAFIAATKAVLAHRVPHDRLPEFSTYGNMGFTGEHRLVLVDEDLLPMFLAETERAEVAGSDLTGMGYEALLFCLNYEYALADGRTDVCAAIATDPLYVHHVFSHAPFDGSPEKLGSLLKRWYEVTSGVYSNLPALLNGK